MKHTKFILTFALAAVLSATNPLKAQEPPEQHDARMQWWRGARFGMFGH